MHLLIPGRHHLLTAFQFQYLWRFAQRGLGGTLDSKGQPLPDEALEGIVFAITSANHAGTRRNPLPLLLRALQVHGFAQGLGIPVHVYGIPDAGIRDDFAALVAKTIAHESGGLVAPDPRHTIVAGSTPAMGQWEALGYRVYPAELAPQPAGTATPVQPWEVVEAIAREGLLSPAVLATIHPASLTVWKQYGLEARLGTIFSDPLVGSDGDLTATRDYRTYVQQMDDIADLKFAETVDFIQPGQIGDIGCAVGSWLRLATRQPALVDSDFHGIELARPLYEICRQRKDNGEFATPHVWFSQRNAVSGLCFAPGRMNTIHTGSLTHEILSYGGPEALHRFIQNRAEELAPGGLWINRDVVGVENPDEPVWLALDPGDQAPHHPAPPPTPGPGDRQSLARSLAALSLPDLLRRFDRDFIPGRPTEASPRIQALGRVQGREVFATTRGFAQDFLMHKDFLDNWASEMHETFTFWSFERWRRAVEEAGLTVVPGSRAWTNPWILQHRWEPCARLWGDPQGTRDLPWFPTTMVLVAKKLA